MQSNKYTYLKTYTFKLYLPNQILILINTFKNVPTK